MIAKFLPFRHCPFRHVDFGQKRHYYIFMVFHYYGLSIFCFLIPAWRHGSAVDHWQSYREINYNLRE